MQSRIWKRSLILVVILLGLISSGVHPAQAAAAGFVEHAKTELSANQTYRVRFWGWAALDGNPTWVAAYEYIQNTGSYVFVGLAYAGTPRPGQPGVYSFDMVLPPLGQLPAGQTDHEIRILESSTAVELGTFYTAANFDKPLQSGHIRVNGDPGEYALVSNDQIVRVGFHKRYGGAILQVYNQNQGNFNLVDDDQGGAMFQTAFWLYPWHPLPPSCTEESSDMHFDNPTQAGFKGAGVAGNPIGLMGTGPQTDNNEFIRHENGKLHLKTRFIRFDYCAANAPTNRQSEWDTTFYLEQWAYFLGNSTTLVLDSTITNAGVTTREVSTRQLPVLFARNLPKLSYLSGATLQTITIPIPAPLAPPLEDGVSPSKKWAALTADAQAGTQKGIGMVINPNTTMMSSNNLFGYVGGIDGAAPFTALSPAGINGTISPSGGRPNLSTMGQLASTVVLSGTNYLFPQNGWFKWRTHYPIGELAGTIKPQSDSLLSPSNYATYWTINW